MWEELNLFYLKRFVISPVFSLAPKKFMRTRLCIFLFLALGPAGAFGQKETRVIDSLKNLIRSPKNDSNLSYLQDVLAKEYGESNTDSSIHYAKRSLQMAKKIRLVQYQVDALNTLGIATRKKGDYREALRIHFEALELIRKNKIEGYYLNSVYTALCLTYTEQGNFTAAIEYGFKTLHIAEKEKDTLNQAITNTNIANIYFNIKQYPKALFHYKKALDLALQVGNLYGQGLLTGNIGSVYYEADKLDSAKLFYERSLAIAKQVNDVFGEGYNYQNLGSYYQKKGMNKEALAFFEKGEKIFKENGMDPDLGVAYYNMATSYLEMKEYQRSKQYAERSLALAQKINSYPQKQSAHLALKNVNEKLNNVSAAYFHYREYVAARDSIYNQENRKAQFKAELEYEYAKKRDVDSLNQVVAVKIQQEQLHQEQLRTETQRKFTYAAMIGCLLLLVLLVFIFKGYKDKQKANQIITAQKRETEMQKEIIEEKQKEILDSIHYAKRIQQSLLPSDKYIQRMLNRDLKKK